MRKCPKCGSVIDNDKAKFCKKCGTKLEEPKVLKNTESLNDKPNAYFPSSNDNDRRESRNDEGISLGNSTYQSNDDDHKEQSNSETIIEGRNISFMEAVKKCFCDYCTFSGRAKRKEFWSFYLFNVLIFLGVYLLLLIVPNEVIILSLASFAIVYGLGTILPNIAVSVRRLHDIGKSGWWYLLILIPYIGCIVLIIFFCLKSESHENKYGKPS